MANITRIKNNQITDSTITSAKIAAGTLVGTNFSNNLTLNSNVTILGNLNVSGNSSTINSVNTFINDPIVLFNNGYSGSLAGYDIGIMVNRNLATLGAYGSVNTAWVWDENQQAFLAVATTTTTTSNNISSITNSGFANVKAGNVTANSLTISTGTIVATAGGVQNTPIGSATASTGAFTTLTATTATPVTLNATNGNVITLFATNFSTGNAQITGGNITGDFSVSGTTGQFTNFSTGNAQITGGNTTGMTGGTFTTLQSTNFSTGNAQITGGNISGDFSVSGTTGQFTNFSTGNAQITGGSVSGMASLATTYGNIAVLNVTGNVGTSLIPQANVAYDLGSAAFRWRDLYLSGNTINLGTATITSTGSSVTTGNAVLTGSTLISNFSTANAYITGGQITGITNLAATTAVATNLSSGNILVTGGSATGLTNLTATTAQATNFSTGNAQITGGNTTGMTSGTYTTLQATNFSSGNARITGGYADNFPIGANTAATGAFTTLTASGATTVTNSGASTSTSTGALVVTGGVGIGGNLWVSGVTNIAGNVSIGGNLTVTGQSVSIGASTLSINDPIINLNTPTDLSPLTSATTNDIGVKLHYYDSADSAAFFGRANDTGFFEWYARGTDVANVFTGTAYGTIKTGELVLANTTPSTSTATGALRISGGLGVAGNMYALGVNATNGNVITLVTTNFSSSNAQITGGSLSGITNLATTTSVATNFSSGNAQITGGNTTGMTSGTYTTLQATNFSSGNITGTFYGTIAGTGATANVSLYENVQTTSSASTFYPAFYNATTGNLAAYTNSALNFRPSDGYLFTTVACVGAVYGDNGTITSLRATNFSSANILVTGGSTTGMTSGTFTTLQATNFSTANAQITGTGSYLGTGGSIANSVYATTGFFTNLSTPNLSVTSENVGTSVVTNFSTGNAQITGGNISGDFSVSGTTGQFTNFSTGNARIASGYADNFPIGANTAAPGTFTTITSTGAIKSAGNIVANATTPSTSVTTGALVVAGGAGFGANVLVNTGANINVSQAAGADFITSGATDKTLIWARSSATYDQVLIGNSATTSTLVRGAKLHINSTDSLIIPVGSTAQQPGNSGGTNVAGMMRFNTTTNSLEVYTGSSWQTFTTSFTVITDQQFTGDGATSTFTLSSAQTTASCIISINGVVQAPTGTYGSAYSVSGTTLTFTEAPAVGDVIDVRALTTTVSVTSIASTNGYMQFLVDNNGAYVYTGSASSAATTYWDTTGAQVNAIANVSVASANTPTTIDTMSTSTYRSAKYIVQVSNGSTYQVMEALVISNGTTATVTTYGTIGTNGNLGVLSATQSGSNALLQFSAANATNNVRIKKDYLLI